MLRHRVSQERGCSAGNPISLYGRSDSTGGDFLKPGTESRLTRSPSLPRRGRRVGSGTLVFLFATIIACGGGTPEPDLPQAGEESEKRELDIVPTPGPIPDSLQPVYVVDGEVMDFEAFERLHIEPFQIHAIEVLKGEAAMALVGPKGIKGVLDITLKIPLRDLAPKPDSGG
jgi:hypothetical protein